MEFLVECLAFSYNIVKKEKRLLYMQGRQELFKYCGHIVFLKLSSPSQQYISFDGLHLGTVISGNE